MKAGPREVKVALILFRRSLERDKLTYTNIVCDSDSLMFPALHEDAA